MQKVNDEDLVILLKDGNELAFQELYNRYWEKLYIAAYKVLGDQASSEDVVQEIFLDFWHRSLEIQVSNVKAYLYQAVRFQVSKHIRRMKFTEKRAEIIERHHLSNNIEEYLFHKELGLTLEKSIDSLPDRCKEIFKLSRNEHLSNKEIAKKLGLSVRTVETQIRNALKRLRHISSVSSLLTFLSQIIS